MLPQLDMLNDVADVVAHEHPLAGMIQLNLVANGHNRPEPDGFAVVAGNE